MSPRALASAAGACTTVMAGSLVVSAVGYSLAERGTWLGGATVAGLASFAGAYLLGRSHEAAKSHPTSDERNPS